jgi:plastocyanin
VVQVGWLPPSSASGGTATASPGASGAPAGSGAPPASGAPGGSGAPPASGAPGGGTGDVSLTAKGVAFVETSLTLPAGKLFTLAFDNEDAGTPHNVEIKDAGGTVVFKGEIFNGVATKVYDVPALTAGSYTFLCIVHQAMTGTATAQ